MTHQRIICYVLVTLGVFTSRIVANFEHQFEKKQDVDESLIARIQTNINTFLEQGFKNAEQILDSENKGVDYKEDSMDENLLFYHSRKTNKISFRLSSCKGLGILETSKLVAKHFNIPNDKVYKTLKQISLPSEFCKKLDEKCNLKNQAESRNGCNANLPYRSHNGNCNNLMNPNQGAAHTPQKRLLEPVYEGGTCDPRGHGLTGSKALPNPRHLSVDLNNILGYPAKSKVLTQMIKAWGQFFAHDIILSPESVGGIWGSQAINCCEDGKLTASSNRNCLPIDVRGDYFFSRVGVQCLRFVRSLASPQSNCNLGVREQMNQITSYIDASNVYGSDPLQAWKVRAYKGGKLRTNKEGEEGNCTNLPQLCPLSFLPEKNNEFIAGDIRVNVQPGLISMHSIFVRYHNKIADVFNKLYPTWNDEKLFQETRKIVGALMQHITYSEYLPVLLGPGLTSQHDIIPLPYGHQYHHMYESYTDASISNAFGAAAFRFGHSTIGDNLLGKDQHSLPLMFNFFNSNVTKTEKFFPSHLTRGECSLQSEQVDTSLVLSVHNYLGAEGPRFTHGSDLMALNIMRGRDHGLPPYNSWREFCGLEKFRSFDDLKSEMSEKAVNVFKKFYSTVDDIDLYPAGLAENKVSESIVGPTFGCILGKQFRDLKFGDRFWYENAGHEGFTANQLIAIRKVTLATIICETTSNKELQEQVMLLPSPGNSIKSCDDLRKNSIVNSNILKFWGEKNEAGGFPHHPHQG